MIALFDALTRTANPGHRFLEVKGHRTWSYGEIFELAARMATVLRDHGAFEGTRLLVQVEKSPEAVALYLAALRVGTVYVPINPAYTDAEVAFFVEDSAPVLFVTDPHRPGDSTYQTTRSLTLAADGSGTLLDSAGTATPDISPTPRSGTQMAAILYTSGTTGRPKGAMLSSDNLVANAETLFETWGWRADDILLHLLPIFHTHGLFVALHLAMMGGSKVLFHDRFAADTALRALPGATVMMGVPTYYHRLVADSRLDESDLSKVRLFTSGSAPLSELVHNEFDRRTGHRILERYGMTEAGMLASNPLDGDRLAGSVGFALPGVNLRVVDHDGNSCSQDQAGAVQVRGANVFSGYWHSPDGSAAEFTDDGFFDTGDIGSLDDDGRLTLAGRSSDMIISGGLNVYPREVELVLDAHPGVTESAVIGLPHPDLGEIVVAVIVPSGDLDAKDLEAHTAEALARYKRPKHYEPVELLPRNAMGKVAKPELRRRLAGSLNGPSSSK